MPDGRVPRLRSRGEMRRPARAQGLRMTRARIRVRYRKNRALWEVDYRDAPGVDPGRELVRLTRVRRYRVRAERCAIDDPGPVDGSGGAHIACHPPGPAVSTRKQARNCALCLALEE